MENIFTLEDIHNLLAMKYPKIEWNYEVYDSKSGKKRAVTLDDFAHSWYRSASLVCYYRGDEYALDVTVDNYNFIVYEDVPNIMGSGSTTRVKDGFTNDWIKLLLNEHKKEYANILLNYCENRKNQIQEEAEKKIADYANGVYAKVTPELYRYKQLADKAKVVLSKQDEGKGM